MLILEGGPPPPHKCAKPPVREEPPDDALYYSTIYPNSCVLLESPFLLGISDPQSSGLSSLKGDAKHGGLRLTPDGFTVVALQLASWFLF